MGISYEQNDSFTGGGTAGHVMINIVLIPKFIEKGWRVSILDPKMELKNH